MLTTSVVPVECLEWGKLCVSADGPVSEGRDHELLGTSPGFPAALIPFCNPNRLGVASSAYEARDESLFTSVQYGTVMRPVIVDDVTYTVLCRVGTRLEDSSGRAAREYSLARYLVTSDPDVSPAALHAAMGPLLGISEAEAGALHAVSVERAGDDEPTAFGDDERTALRFLLSGIPISAPAKERDFFAFVDRVWRALPQQIRPYLSAGWNVTRSTAESLAIAASPRASADRVEYRDGVWIPPTPSTDGSLTALGDLHFAQYVDRDVAAARSLVEYVDRGAWRPTGAPLNAVPAFRDAALIERFRAPAVAAGVSTALDHMREWLSGAESGDLPRDSAALVGSTEAAAVYGAGFSDPAHWDRADASYAEYLKGGGTPARLDSTSTDAGVLRMRVITAAFGAEPKALLDILGAAARAGAADRFSHAIQECVIATLDGTIDLVADHVALCETGGHATVYIDWLEKAAPALTARCLDQQHIAFDAIVRGVRVINTTLAAHGRDAREPRAVLAILSAEPPHSTERGTVGGSVALATAIALRWNHSDVTRVEREQLVEWVRAAAPAANVLPVALRGIAGASLTAEEIRAAVDECSDASLVPAVVHDILARDALHFARTLQGVMRADRARWEPLFSRWPAAARVALIGVAAPQRDIDSSVNDYVPETAHLDELIADWASHSRGERRHAAADDLARVLWLWASQSHESRSSTSTVRALCAATAGGTWTVVREAEPSPATTRVAAALIRSARALNDAPETADRLWASSTVAWQLQFLLDAFPAVDFKPREQDLVLLVARREWVREHLMRPDIVAARHERFRLATYGVGELPATEAERMGIVDSMSDSILAAAVAGRDLADRVLEVSGVFSRTPREAGTIYLRVVVNAPQKFERRALIAVAKAVRNWGGDAGLDTRSLMAVFTEVARPRGSIRSLVVNADRGAPPFQRTKDCLVLADYMVVLLWEIGRRLSSSDLRRAIAIPAAKRPRRGILQRLIKWK
jgi:hypothetical protein